MSQTATNQYIIDLDGQDAVCREWRTPEGIARVITHPSGDPEHGLFTVPAIADRVREYSVCLRRDGEQIDATTFAVSSDMAISVCEKRHPGYEAEAVTVTQGSDLGGPVKRATFLERNRNGRWTVTDGRLQQHRYRTSDGRPRCFFQIGDVIDALNALAVNRIAAKTQNTIEWRKGSYLKCREIDLGDGDSLVNIAWIMRGLSLSYKQTTRLLKRQWKTLGNRALKRVDIEPSEDNDLRKPQPFYFLSEVNEVFPGYLEDGKQNRKRIAQQKKAKLPGRSYPHPDDNEDSEINFARAVFLFNCGYRFLRQAWADETLNVTERPMPFGRAHEKVCSRKTLAKLRREYVPVYQQEERQFPDGLYLLTRIACEEAGVTLPTLYEWHDNGCPYLDGAKLGRHQDVTNGPNWWKKEQIQTIKKVRSRVFKNERAAESPDSLTKAQAHRRYGWSYKLMRRWISDFCPFHPDGKLPTINRSKAKGNNNQNETADEKKPGGPSNDRLRIADCDIIAANENSGTYVCDANLVEPPDGWLTSKQMAERNGIIDQTGLRRIQEYLRDRREREEIRYWQSKVGSIRPWYYDPAVLSDAESKPAAQTAEVGTLTAPPVVDPSHAVESIDKPEAAPAPADPPPAPIVPTDSPSPAATKTGSKRGGRPSTRDELRTMIRKMPDASNKEITAAYNKRYARKIAEGKLPKATPEMVRYERSRMNARERKEKLLATGSRLPEG